MDSLSQLVLGAALAGAIAPPEHRRAALLAGAALGTLPDLDSLLLAPLGLDPVQMMTWHRGPSHSLFVLVPLAALMWAGFRRLGGRVAQAPARWFWAIQLALVTHPLLDAFTVYGTQLFWPLGGSPVMWSSLFIIDPAYTLPLLVAVVWAWVAPARPSAQRALVLGLALSTAYVAWSVAAKVRVEQHAGQALAAMGLADQPRFSTPMPFNTLLWRVVVMTQDGYLEGERSLVADAGPMVFRAHRSDAAAMDAVAGFPAVQRLRWFNRGFMAAGQDGERLVLSDLRMGAEPDYIFQFAVARQEAGHWQPIPPEQVQRPWNASRRLAQVWRRIWVQEPLPDEAAP